MEHIVLYFIFDENLAKLLILRLIKTQTEQQLRNSDEFAMMLFTLIMNQINQPVVYYFEHYIRSNIETLSHRLYISITRTTYRLNSKIYPREDMVIRLEILSLSEPKLIVCFGNINGARFD